MVPVQKTTHICLKLEQLNWYGDMPLKKIHKSENVMTFNIFINVKHFCLPGIQYFLSVFSSLYPLNPFAMQHSTPSTFFHLTVFP